MLQLNSAPSRSYSSATRAHHSTGHADDACKWFPSPCIPVESTASIWGCCGHGEIVIERHRSINRVTLFTKCVCEVAKLLPSDTAPRPEDARRSTRSALGLISGFGTDLTRSRISPRSVVEGRPEATGRRQECRECRVGPGNFTPSPLTLSRHPARATARRLPPSIEHRVLPVAG
jgi:hypothetical protein